MNVNEDIDWGHGSDDEKKALDVVLGTVVETMWQDGDLQSWGLLQDVTVIEVEWKREMRSLDLWMDVLWANVSVDPVSLDRFAGEAGDRIGSRIGEVARRLGCPIVHYAYVRALPSVAPLMWRDQQAERGAMKAPVTNQAVRDYGKDFVLEDGLRFRSTAERDVYLLLKKLQTEAPAAKLEMSLLPLPSALLPNGSVREPDFLVVVNKKVGIIEVDGDRGHAGKRAHDTSRDRLFNASGVWMVEHVSTEDLDDLDGLAVRLKRWLLEVARQA